jgi:hypothetical protein
MLGTQLSLANLMSKRRASSPGPPPSKAKKVAKTSKGKEKSQPYVSAGTVGVALSMT